MNLLQRRALVAVLVTLGALLAIIVVAGQYVVRKHQWGTQVLEQILEAPDRDVADDVPGGERAGAGEQLLQLRLASGSREDPLQHVVAEAHGVVVLVRGLRLRERCELRVDRKAGIIVARQRGTRPPSIGRKVGIMTGGTSDVVVAEEARAIAEEMGCMVITAYDVGIAGFHRHIKPLKKMLQEDVDAIIVVAGMEGALPSVIASLVHVPVIGVPTSVGYGFGAGGVGALTTMLQSCSPGICVVNIDNGVGAGALAALIAHQVATALRLGSGQALKEGNR